MANKDIENQPSKSLWNIDLDWFQQASRSVVTLILSVLCSDCAKQHAAGEKDSSPEVLITAVKDCCSRNYGFISERSPIMESTFRILLANGNRALKLGDISRQLSELRVGDAYRTSPETLYRLLKHDNFYGIRELTA